MYVNVYVSNHMCVCVSVCVCIRSLSAFSFFPGVAVVQDSPAVSAL